MAADMSNCQLSTLQNASSSKTPQQISLKFGFNFFQVKVVLPKFWSWSAVWFQKKSEKEKKEK